MKLTSIVFCLALLGGALTSCIDEDIDDCFSINRLTLSYKGDGTTEIFPDKICRVEMYVFDAENKCVNSHTLHSGMRLIKKWQSADILLLIRVR